MQETQKSNAERFIDGTVFGFDLGTASIGYAVRKGGEFLDVGVLLCSEDTSDLELRRGLRRQRRTTNNRNRRRKWFAEQLSQLGFPLPKKEERANDPSLSDPVALRVSALNGEKLTPHQLHVALAHIAKRRGYQDGLPWAGGYLIPSNDEEEEKFVDEAPKKKSEAIENETDKNKSQLEDELKTRKAVLALRQAMTAFRSACTAAMGRAPQAADYLDQRDRARNLWIHCQKSGKSVSEEWARSGLFGDAPTTEPHQRREIWPREYIEDEVRDIFAAQATHYPVLAETREFTVVQKYRRTDTPELVESSVYEKKISTKTCRVVDWLLHGACEEFVTKDQRTFHVFYRATDPGKIAPGLLGLLYPRFDNRHPHLDLLTPYDTEGRPVHVARKNKPEAKESLFEQAILNFRVTEKSSGKQVIPDDAALAVLRNLYQSGRAKAAKLAKKPAADHKVIASVDQKPDSVKVTTTVLKAWLKQHPQYELIEGQKELVASLGKGRARFCRENLQRLAAEFSAIARGRKGDDSTSTQQIGYQPQLRSANQSAGQALNSFFSGVKHGLVQHRLRLFHRLLSKLTETHGVPDNIVFETARSLSFGKSRREEIMREQGKSQKQRQNSIEELRKANRSTSKKSILRYRLWVEAGYKCPFCLQGIDQSSIYNAEVDIAHLYPKSLAPCQEQWNLTISHTKCNHEMGDRIPRDAYGSLDRWNRMEEFARTHFKGKKLQIFLAQTLKDAEKMVRPGGSLAQTGYIGKMIRQVCLIHFSDHGWLHEGRDPTGQINHPGVLALKPSNGQITASLRKAWGLDAVLHPRPKRLTDAEELALSDEEMKARAQSRQQVYEKNRGDHRHHAIDAMVLACTWPARALRVHEVTKEGIARGQERRARLGAEDGYFYWDEKRQALLADHPLYEDHRAMRRNVERWCERLVDEGRVQHHQSKSNHKGGYKLNYLARKTYRRPGELSAHPMNKAFYQRDAVHSLSLSKILGTQKGAPYLNPPDMQPYLAGLWQSYAADMEAFLMGSADAFAAFAEADEKNPGKRNDEIIAEFRSGLCYDAFAAWQRGDKTAAAACLQKATRRITDDLDKAVYSNLIRNQQGGWAIEWKGKAKNGKEPQPLRSSAFPKLPRDFTDRLCFASFQRWRASSSDPASRPVPTMPSRIVVPIKNLMMRVCEDESALAKVTGRDGVVRYVARKEYQRVEIVEGMDGSVVLLFMPFFKGDQPYAPFGDPKPGGKRHLVLSKGSLVRFPQAWGNPASDVYLLGALNPSGQPHLMFPHVVREKKSMAAFGHSSSGWKPYWDAVVIALGFIPAWKTGKHVATEDEECDEVDDT